MTSVAPKQPQDGADRQKDQVIRELERCSPVWDPLEGKTEGPGAEALTRKDDPQ